MLDVVVVGAGLAGLRTARLLQDRGLDVVVLEARERVGGRLHTRHLGDAELDVGGQWLGPGQDRAYALANALGLRTFGTFTEGKKVLELDGRRRTYRGSIPTLSPLGLAQLQLLLLAIDGPRRLVDPAAPETAPFAGRLDASTVEAYRRGLGTGREVRGVMDAALRAIFGAEASDLSALHFLAYLHAGGGLMALAEAKGGAQQDRLAEGAQALCTGLAGNRLGDPLRLRLGAPVREVLQSAEDVTVRGEFGALEARHVVLTLPPPLLPALRFDPPVLPERVAGWGGYAMGSAIKVIALYDRPFWREAGYSGEIVSSDGPLSVVYDDCARDGSQAALVGFVAGRDAQRLKARPQPEWRAAVLHHLERTLGPAAAHATDVVFVDWAEEPYSGGCPVAHAQLGALTGGPSADAVLRAPHGRVLFAGTETAREHIGYMEGALESAERVVDQLIRSAHFDAVGA